MTDLEKDADRSYRFEVEEFLLVANRLAELENTMKPVKFSSPMGVIFQRHLKSGKGSPSTVNDQNDGQRRIHLR